MTAADHKIIIEKGADFTIEVQAYEGLTPKDLSTDSWTVVMNIQHLDADNTIVSTNTEEVSPKAPSVYAVGSIIDDVNGIVQIRIDNTDTINLPTGINDDTFLGKTDQTDISPFSTEYNHFYTITLVNATTNTEDLRLLRGKCAIRV